MFVVMKKMQSFFLLLVGDFIAGIYFFK